MTLRQRIRVRYGFLSAALRSAVTDIRRGFTMRPIAGADGATDSGEGGGGTDGGTDNGTVNPVASGEGDTPDSGTQTDTEEKPTFDEARAKAELKKKNSEASNLRKRLKELEPLAKKARELEEAQKSETEKLTEAKATAEQEARTAAQEAARLRVALRKGLDETLAKRLVGETDEELEADADELLSSLERLKGDDKNGDKESPEDSKPRPKVGERTGATGEREPEQLDPRKLAEGLPSF